MCRVALLTTQCLHVAWNVRQPVYEGCTVCCDDSMFKEVRRDGRQAERCCPRTSTLWARVPRATTICWAAKRFLLRLVSPTPCLSSRKEVSTPPPRWS